MTKGRTVLIVDDQESVLQTLEYILRSQGYRVLAAGSGLVALELARSEMPDAALIDLHMPGMDGVAVCESLIAFCRERGRPIPIWIMTGGHSSAAESRAREAGALALLRKPFNVPALLKLIESALANSGLASGSAASGQAPQV